MNLVKLVFCFLSLSVITYNVSSQYAPITTISSAYACPGDTIVLHVSATNCSYLSGITLQLVYDASVLSLINPNPFGYVLPNIYNTNSALYAYNGNFWTCQTNFSPGFKKVTPVWGGMSTGGVLPATVINIAQLFDLSFRYFGGSTNVIFNNSIQQGFPNNMGDYCEYSDTLGNPYIDTPTVNYYINGTVTQVTPPTQPSLINGYVQPIIGDTTVYSVANVPRTNYTWSAPSTWIGLSNTSSMTYIVGTDTGTIIVTPSNCAGSGPPRTLNVFPMNGITIKGILTYDNIACTPLDSVWMYLNLTGNTFDSVQTDTLGKYQFNVASNGAYNITSATHKPWGGVNSTDAVKVKRHFAGSELLTSSLRLHAADVNISLGINTTDAVGITRRFVGSDTSFEKGDWVFEKPLGGDSINVSTYLNDSIIINGNNIKQNFKGLCTGDVNGSYYPAQGAKFPPKVIMEYYGLKKLKPDEYFELPVFATSDMNIGAVSLILTYPKSLIKFTGAELLMNENLTYKDFDGELRIGWFENETPITLRNDQPFIILKGKTSSSFKPGDIIRFSIQNNSLCEFADENGEPIENVVLKTFSIQHSDDQNSRILPDKTDNELFIYPNPADNFINFRYRIANDCQLKISLFNILGEKVTYIVNKPILKGSYSSSFNLSSVPPGVYTIKMTINGRNVIVKRLIISK